MPHGPTILAADGSTYDRAGHRRGLIRLLFQMSAYYAVFGTIFVLTLLMFPKLAYLFPIGGIEEFSANVGAEVSEFNDILTGEIPPTEATQAGGLSNSGPWLMEAVTLFLAMLSTFLLMLPVSWVYKKIHEGDEYDHSIDETTLILPAIFAGIITVVQHSLTLAFALAGIMAGVRFRRALNDTFDGVGLAAGASSIEIAIVITVFFNYTTVLVCIFGDGLESKYEAQRESAKQLEKRRKRELEEEKARRKEEEAEAKALESARNEA
jgi:hypothetical protein